MLATLRLDSSLWEWIAGLFSLAVAALVLWDRRRIGTPEDTPWWSPLVWALAVFLVPVMAFAYWGRRRSILYDRETARRIHATAQRDA